AEIGELSWLSTIAGLLAEAVHRQGRDEEAEELAAASERSAGAEDAYSHALLRAVRAKIAARRGDGEPAVRWARSPVEPADTADFAPLRVHAGLAAAAAHWSAGDDPGPPLREALALAEAKGSVADAARTREQIARVGSGEAPGPATYDP